MAGWSAKSLARGGAWRLADCFFGGWGLVRQRFSTRTPSTSLHDVRSILAIRLDLLGDLVFTLPALVALRDAAPRARISVLALPYTADLLRGHPAVDRVITVDVNRWRRPGAWTRGTALRELRSAVSEIRAEPYDLAISFYGRVGAAAALLSGARRLVGYGAEGYPFSFDVAVSGSRYKVRQHEAEYCLDLARAVGAPAARLEERVPGTHHPVVGDGEAAGHEALAHEPRLSGIPEAAAAMERLLSDEGVTPQARLVALHPGALNMISKRWLPDRWAEVADRTQRELGCRIVLVGSASERPLADSVRRAMTSAPVMMAGRTSVAELAALLGRCDLFLGGDSGPLHIASALDVPSVSIYGPTDPEITGPLSERARVLRAEVECGPCYRPGSPPECHRVECDCMAQVSVAEVFEAVREAVTGEYGDAGSREGEGPARAASLVEVPPVWGNDEAVREEAYPPARNEGAVREGPHRPGGDPRPLPLGEGRGEGSPANSQNPDNTTYVPELGTQHSAPSTQNQEPRTQNSPSVRRILVVKLAGIGDMLTAFPALASLRQAYPQARIDALVTPVTASLSDRSGFVDRTIVLDKYLFDEARGFLRPHRIAGLIQLSVKLRRQRYDATVLLHHLLTWPGVAKYALLILATGASLRAGLDDGRGWFLNRTAPDLGFGALHEVEYWQAVVGSLGAKPSDSQARVSWGPEEDAFADQAWGRLGLVPADQVVALHPGTGSYSPVRQWGVEKFAEVARTLAEDGLVPVIVAGPGEEDVARKVVDLAGGRCSLLEGVPSLFELAALLARCRLFVGNDSGVTHLALAAGVRVVAVFGPSNAGAWAPYDPVGEQSRVVRLGLPCSPCLYRGQSLGLRYGCGDPRCLRDLPASAVISAARELLRYDFKERI